MERKGKGVSKRKGKGSGRKEGGREWETGRDGKGSKGMKSSIKKEVCWRNGGERKGKEGRREKGRD